MFPEGGGGHAGDEADNTGAGNTLQETEHQQGVQSGREGKALGDDAEVRQGEPVDLDGSDPTGKTGKRQERQSGTNQVQRSRPLNSAGISAEWAASDGRARLRALESTVDRTTPIRSAARRRSKRGVL